jgi:hypothetical protein
MRTTRSLLAALGVAMGALSTALGCASESSSSSSTSTTVATPLCSDITHTCSALKTAFTGSAVTVTCADGDGSALLTATGLPPYQTTQTGLAVAQDWELAVPLQARCNAAPESFTDGDVAIGLLWNGVVLYPARSTSGATFGASEGSRLDRCGGVTGNGCAYVTRGASPCSFGEGVALASKLESDGHGALVGWMVDGFPFHAAPLASGEPALNACNGHETPTRGFHYHAAPADGAAPPCLIGRDRGDLRFTATIPASCNKSQPTGPGDSGTGPSGDSGTGPRDGGGDSGTGPRDGGGTGTSDSGSSGGPPSCTTSADCTSMKCPPTSKGCTCATDPSGSKICVPTCTTTSDCPTGTGLPTFSCSGGLCVPG